MWPCGKGCCNTCPVGGFQRRWRDWVLGKRQRGEGPQAAWFSGTLSPLSSRGCFLKLGLGYSAEFHGQKIGAKTWSAGNKAHSVAAIGTKMICQV